MESPVVVSRMTYETFRSDRELIRLKHRRSKLTFIATVAFGVSLLSLMTIIAIASYYSPSMCACVLIIGVIGVTAHGLGLATFLVRVASKETPRRSLSSMRVHPSNQSPITLATDGVDGRTKNPSLLSIGGPPSLPLYALPTDGASALTL